MESRQDTSFRRKIGSERIMLMLPLNVVMVGRIRGTVHVEPRQCEEQWIACAKQELRTSFPIRYQWAMHSVSMLLH